MPYVLRPRSIVFRPELRTKEIVHAYTQELRSCSRAASVGSLFKSTLQDKKSAGNNCVFKCINQTERM